MNFIENGTEGHPALALIATRTRNTGSGNKRHTVRAGEIRAIRLIPAVDGIKAARRGLIEVVKQPGGGWERNWRIAQGAAVNTPEENAQAAAHLAAMDEREEELSTLPWFSVDHTTPRRSGYSGFDDAQAICDYINRQVGERIGSAGEDARDAMQEEVNALDHQTVEIYGIRVVKREA